MFRLITAITIAACAATSLGCSANHNLGPSVDTPGVEVRGPSLFAPARIKVDSNCIADLDSLKYGDLDLQGAHFGQRTDEVTLAQIEKLRAIGQGQSDIARARGEAIAQGIHASADVIDSIIPIFQWLQLGKLTPHESGMQLTLPNGLSVGNKSITGNAELQTALAQLLVQAQQARSAVSTAQAAASQPVAGGQ